MNPPFFDMGSPELYDNGWERYLDAMIDYPAVVANLSPSLQLI
jgi:hypothetical protein